MAQITQKAAAAPAADREPSDMEVLHPERVLELGGDQVTVREYSNLEWLRALPVAEPLVAAIAAMLVGEQEPGYEVALGAIAKHSDGLVPLIAQSVDRDLAWLDALHPTEFETVLMTWWAVNGHFFVRRASNRQAIEQASAAMKARVVAQSVQTVASAGVRSTPLSSPMATSAATSAPTPSDS